MINSTQMRKYIISQLVDVPEGKRIYIDRELLNDAIFFKGTDKNGYPVKIPVWADKYLRKIDLSEISFDNVFFNIRGEEEILSIKEILSKDDFTKFLKRETFYTQENEKEDMLIDFSYTNAKIDFSRIYDSIIENCSFEGVDLSNANGKFLDAINHCNLADTNILIDLKKEHLSLMRTDFSNNDFSRFILDAGRFNADTNDNAFLDCNFSNTGMRITYKPARVPAIYYDSRSKYQELNKRRAKLLEHACTAIQDDMEYANALYKTLQELEEKSQTLNDIVQKYEPEGSPKYHLENEVKIGHLGGCCINNKRIPTLTERRIVALMRGLNDDETKINQKVLKK